MGERTRGHRMRSTWRWNFMRGMSTWDKVSFVVGVGLAAWVAAWVML